MNTIIDDRLKNRELSSCGQALDMEHFGLLQSSSEYVDDPVALHQRVKELGYLYLPGFFKREDVFEVRMHLLEQLNARGMISQEHPLENAVYDAEGDTWAEDQNMLIDYDRPYDYSKVDQLIFGSRAQAFFDQFFGEPARHFDFTWLRGVRPISGVATTPPHCDIVYMGRGTFDLYTMWVPYGDVAMEEGPLMVLEDSHKKNDQLQTYMERDVDEYCSNRPDAEQYASGEKSWSGVLTHNAVNLRKKMGGRWLSADYKMGDVLIFGMGMVHSGMDGQGNRIRLSSDCRYQAASQPADERWVGEVNLISLDRRRGRVC